MVGYYNRFFVTGGTGTLGMAIVDFLYNVTKADIVIFSRDEYKQSQMMRKYDSRVKFHLGDIRDIDSLKKSMKECDFVIHSGAFKHIDMGEFNPLEFVKTNIDGTNNVVRVAEELGIRKLIGISTDKASNPSSLYGASKLIADKIVVDAGYTVVRLGNIIASRGSFLEYAGDLNELSLTDKRMTRFWISKEEASRFIFSNNVFANEGCIIIPKMNSISLGDMVHGLYPEKKVKVTGLRDGEKMHETAVSDFEAFQTTELTDCYVIHKNFTEADLHTRVVDSQFVGEEITSETALRNSKKQSVIDELKRNI